MMDPTEPSANGLGFSNGVALVAMNTTLTGGIMIGAGTVATIMSCTGLVVDSATVNSLLVVVSNGSVNVGMLTIGSGTTVQGVNATAFVVTRMTMRGTFTLDAFWGRVLRSQALPFSDDFERYANSTDMAQMGFYRWRLRLLMPRGRIVAQGTGVTVGQVPPIRPS